MNDFLFEQEEDERKFLSQILHTLRRIEKLMATKIDLDTAVAKIATDITTLIAAIQAVQPVDLQSTLDALNALDAQVKSAIVSLTPPPTV